MIPFIEPEWPVPSCVSALATTRLGGVSKNAWQSLNLDSNCGDLRQDVAENMRRLEEFLPAPAKWLAQVHGNVPVRHDGITDQLPEADAIFSEIPGRVCAVLSADCLPVLFADIRGRRVAAAHAGWRGLVAGVLRKTVESLDCAPEELMAWLGPCIGRGAYQVGEDVRQAFVRNDNAAKEAFRISGRTWLADLNLLARQQLEKTGVHRIYGSDFCTYSDPERFFSYRRDGLTGRMATLIWLK